MTSPLLFILSFLLTLQNAGSSTEERFCQPIDNLTVTESRCSVLPHHFSTTSTFSTTYVLHFEGFGGHEYLPLFGIYNANARLYDPLLGRFLSPDTYIQNPSCSQNYDRYAYKGYFTTKTDSYHNFPELLDQSIINNGTFALRDDLSYWYFVRGSINDTNGIYTIGINKDGMIYHRMFYEYKF